MDFCIRGPIAKVDDERHLIFGWASVVTIKGEPVVDTQGDTIEPAELERAAYDFVLRARVGGDMHERIGVAMLVESAVFTAEKQAALGVDLGMEGWFVGFYVPDEATWKLIKEGKRPMFSIGGVAQREEITDGGTGT